MAVSEDSLSPPQLDESVEKLIEVIEDLFAEAS